MKEDYKFALELERFKQKDSLENKTYYTFLVVLLAISAYFYKRGNYCDFGLSLIVLVFLLVLGEFLIHKYLDKQVEEIERRFK